MTPEAIEALQVKLTKAASRDAPLNFDDATDASYYIGDLHGSDDPVKRLRKAIDRTEGQSVHLFTGQIGSGKTTELFRLQHVLKQQTTSEPPPKVYYVDVKSWLNVSEEVHLSNFLVGLLAAWSYAAQGSDSNAQMSYVDRFFEFLYQTKVIAKSVTLEKSIAGNKIGLQLALETDETFRKMLHENVQKQGADFVSQAHAYAAKLKQDLCQQGQKCVLLVDSLEQVRGWGEKFETVYASMQQLFIGNSRALKIPSVHVIYSISPFVLEQNPQIAALYGAGVVVNMPSVHVFQNKSNALDPNGLDAVTRLLAARYPQWDQILTQDQLHTLIRACGGDLRDFFRALYHVSLADTQTLPVNDEVIQQAVAQITPPQAIPIEHIRWMAKLEQSHEAELAESSEGANSQLLQRYLNSKHIFAYLNGSTWYSVHPLLRDWILQKASA